MHVALEEQVVRSQGLESWRSLHDWLKISVAKHVDTASPSDLADWKILFKAAAQIDASVTSEARRERTLGRPDESNGGEYGIGRGQLGTRIGSVNCHYVDWMRASYVRQRNALRDTRANADKH
jgi:hypothetical protein